MNSTFLNRFLFTLSFCFVCFLTKGQEFSKKQIQQTIDASVRFLEQNQEDSTIIAEQYKGEWPVFKELTTYYIFIGKKQKKRDSNCFTVAAIHNFLAELYTLDSSQKSIPPMLSKAYDQIKTYEVGEKYNFWKLLPPQRPHKLFGNPDSLPLVRRPTNYKLKSRFINKTANVPEDADDTALGNTARMYQNSILNSEHSLASSAVFDEWTDKNRNNKNWYNHFFLNQDETKAYLTWLYPEHAYKKWSFPKMALNTFFLFVPTSSAYPKAYTPWLPFGANEVDLVVNANILTYLSETKQLKTSTNATNAVAFLESTIQSEEYWKESVYYPNDFHVFYAFAKAYNSEAGLKKESGEKLAKDLLDMQNDDGSFICNKYVNSGDTIQSTAYALHALEDLAEAGISIPEEARTKAVEFLMRNARNEEGTLSWEGGVFFSGGTILRYVLYWKSDAYTTALIALSLKKHLHNISNVKWF